MTEESHYTIDNAPEPPVPDEEQAQPSTDPGRVDAAEQPPPAADPEGGAGPKEAWREVLTQIDALADSMTRWAKSAVDDPENRRHAAEIRERLEAVGTKIGSAVDEATQTDIGRSVGRAADKTGQAVLEVGGKVAQETGPAVATALTGLAGLLGKAAERVGKAADKEPTADQRDATDVAGQNGETTDGPDGSDAPEDSADPEQAGE